MDRIPLTQSGYESLCDELATLKNETRPSLIEAIAAARAHGDLSENAEYHAARERQSFVEGRIGEIESALARAEVIDVSALSGKDIKFGATVALLNLDADKGDKNQEVVWSIVGDLEADATEGRIGITSPLARALIGRTQGDFVEVSTPRGVKEYKIKKVSFKSLDKKPSKAKK